MQTIREFTGALRLRPGVEAVLVSGNDGLLIEGTTDASLDQQDLAARIPSLLAEAVAVGGASRLGESITVIVEYERGYAIVGSVGNDAVLTVLTTKQADLGAILYHIRSQRSHIGSLV